VLLNYNVLNMEYSNIELHKIVFHFSCGATANNSIEAIPEGTITKDAGDTSQPDRRNLIQVGLRQRPVESKRIYLLWVR
jgi:hypothetical protein